RGDREARLVHVEGHRVRARLLHERVAEEASRPPQHRGVQGLRSVRAAQGCGEHRTRRALSGGTVRRASRTLGARRLPTFSPALIMALAMRYSSIGPAFAAAAITAAAWACQPAKAETSGPIEEVVVRGTVRGTVRHTGPASFVTPEDLAGVNAATAEDLVKHE